MTPRGFLTILLAFTIASTATAEDPQPAVQLKQLKFRVVDPDGKPVAAAGVKPWAMRFGNAHGGWKNDRFGEPKQTTTDDHGQATIEHPPSVTGEPVKTVSVYIDHPDFCVKNTEVPVAANEVMPSVSLERGTKLRVQAVDAATLEPITNPHIQFLSYAAVSPIDRNGHFQKAEGEAGAAGWYESRRLPRDASRLFVATIRDDEVALFSRILKWTPDDQLSHLIIASVEVGVRFEGTIDPAVPRPIKNGRVVGCATTPLDGAQQATSLVWMDTVPINEDGTFLFPSMPRDCDIQLVSLCDGWRSALPDADDARRMAERYGRSAVAMPTFSSPQCWALTGDVAKGTLKMTRTGSCWVRCVRSDGTPVAGVDVGFSPNHFFYGGGSQIFANSIRAVDHVKRGTVPRPKNRDYVGKTDQDGWATIANLPPGSINFGVAGYRIVKPAQGRQATAIVELDNVSATTVTVEPQPD